MKNIWIIGLALVVAACGKDGGSPASGSGGGAPAEDPVVTEIVRLAGSGAPVETGDTQSVVYDEWDAFGADDACDYQVSQISTVTGVRGEELVIDHKRNASALPGNPAGCPAEPRDFIRDESITTSRAEFRGWTAQHIRANISVVEIRNRNTNFTSVTLQSTVDTTHLGARAKKIEIELVNAEGRRLRQTVYVALDSEFLGVLESSRRYLDTGRQIAFYRTTAYRVAGGRLVYP